MIFIVIITADKPLTLTTIINTDLDQSDKIVYCNTKAYTELTYTVSSQEVYSCHEFRSISHCFAKKKRQNTA